MGGRHEHFFQRNNCFHISYFYIVYDQQIFAKWINEWICNCYSFYSATILRTELFYEMYTQW